MKKRKNLNVWPAIVMFLLLTVSTAAAGTIYVDDDATGTNDGSSWADAYNYLQDALTDANSSTKPVEIRVAQGIHKPDHGMNQHLEDRYASFQLQNLVAIKGGYGGIGEPDPNARDIAAYETILSGEISDDEDTLHVVCGSGTDKTAVLDGFTITGGYAWGFNNDGLGGGMYNYAGSPTVRNCTFIENLALSYGGGMCNDGNSCPTLINCVFKNNSATDGGGMDNEYSNPTLINCTFLANSACSYGADGGFGGGMYNFYSNPTLIDCTFTENSSDEWGGAGAMCNKYSSPNVTNSTFINNSGGREGGGGMYNIISSPTLTTCIFSGNSSDRYGGGMYNYDASPVVRDCKFGANSAVGGGAIYISGDLSVTLTDCVFENNTVALGGGAIYCTSSGELSITRCEFRNGIANRGGVIYNGYASLILSECILESNQAKYAGAISTGGDITLTNCLLANNQALVYGGALDNMGSTSRSVNCTFVGNSSNYGGAIFSNIECDTIAINCIFWNNAAQTGSQIATSGDHVGSTLTVNYCDIENLLDGLYVPSGCTLNWGEDNINAEPLFADSDNGDYRLSASSPCIDAGDPNYVAEPNETDLDGKPRVIGGRIDMGAYEYSPPIPAEVRIIPRTINLASKGKWITCYIWLPEDYNIADIKSNTVFLQREIQAQSLSVDEGQQVAIARFSRSEVQDIFAPGDVELAISGELSDGSRFEGTDTIRVIDKGKKK